MDSGLGSDQEEEDNEKALKEIEELLSLGDDSDETAQDVLFAITIEALRDPENFGHENVTIALTAFGLEGLIEEARAHLEDEADEDDTNPQEEAHVEDLDTDE